MNDSTFSQSFWSYVAFRSTRTAAIKCNRKGEGEFNSSENTKHYFLLLGRRTPETSLHYTSLTSFTYPKVVTHKAVDLWKQIKRERGEEKKKKVMHACIWCDEGWWMRMDAYKRVHQTVRLWEPVNKEVRGDVGVVAKGLWLVLNVEKVKVDQQLKDVRRCPAQDKLN